MSETTLKHRTQERNRFAEQLCRIDAIMEVWRKDESEGATATLLEIDAFLGQIMGRARLDTGRN